MPVHTVGRTFKFDNGTVPLSTVVFVVDDEINADILIPAGSDGKEIDIVFTNTTIHDYCITILNAAGTAEAAAGALTLYWDVDGAGTPTMNLVAKTAIWHAPGMGTSNLFTAPITKVFVDNPGTADLTLAIHVGQNLAV